MFFWTVSPLVALIDVVGLQQIEAVLIIRISITHTLPLHN